jgi:superfamily II DNA or RNA helicase
MADTEEIFSNLIQKLHSEVLSDGEISELISTYENRLLIEDLIVLATLPNIPRGDAFKLSRICINNGLAKEPFQAIENHLVGTIHGIEVQIYFDAILAAKDVQRLIDFYWTEESPIQDLAIKIAETIQSFENIQYLIEIVSREMKLSEAQGLEPIKSNRQLFRTIKGEFLYEIKDALLFEDRYVDFRIAKALNRYGRHETAREVVFEYALLGDANAIAIYANSFTVKDYVEGTIELPNEWLHALVDNGAKSFRATAYRVNAYQEFARGDIKNSIGSAQEAAFGGDVESIQFLIHVLNHDRDRWILYLKGLSNIKYQDEIVERFSRSPNSDLDSKNRLASLLRESVVKKDKKSIEELWYCREALWKKRADEIEVNKNADWNTLSCANHKSGIERLNERLLLPPITSSIWDASTIHQNRDFNPINLEFLQETYSLELWPWQKEALLAWSKHGRVGMVEAATGSGKSRLGIASTLEALSQNKAVVVVVPRKILQDQWIKNFKKAGLRRYIDTLGGDGYSIYPAAGASQKGRILIALVQSLSKHLSVLPEDDENLLIADEIHLYTGEEYRKIFSDKFRWRLGMTATLPDDIQDKNLLRNYFGGDPVFNYEIPKAISDEVIMPYEVVLIRVKPTLEERNLLNRHSTEIQNCFRELSRIGAISKVYGNFDVEIAKLEELERFPSITRKYRAATYATDSILANSASNGLALQMVSSLIKARGKTLIFSDFNETMNRTIDVLTAETVTANSINHQIAPAHRDSIINKLVSGEINAIVSPQAMDVGVDIPELEIGVYVGVRRERLNLIQRLGRFLRKSDDKSTPLIIIPVAIGHHDDPNLTGNENLKFSAFHYVVENAIQPFHKFDVHDTQGLKDFVDSRS